MSVPAKIKVPSKIYNSKLSFLYFCIKNLINLATKNDTKKDINPQKCIYLISYIPPAQYVKKELKLVKITEDVAVALTLSLGKFMLSQSGVSTIPPPIPSIPPNIPAYRAEPAVFINICLSNIYPYFSKLKPLFFFSISFNYLLLE